MTAKSDKITRANCRLITIVPWYAFFASQMEFKPDPMTSYPEDQRSMALDLSDRSIRVIYNPDFLEDKTVEEVALCVQHMIEHLMFSHPTRKGLRHPQLWEVATDMVIHGKKSKPSIMYMQSVEESQKAKKGKKLVYPVPEDQMIFLPEEFDEKKQQPTAEFVYEWIASRYPGIQNLLEDSPIPSYSGGQGSGEGPAGDNEQPPQPKNQSTDKNTQEFYDKNLKGKKKVDTESKAGNAFSEQELNQHIHQMANNATTKNRGTAPGHLKEAIEALGKSFVKWNQILSQFLGRHVGVKRSTWSRVDKRIQQFGFKGISRHGAGRITVIVDTSGSISSAELKDFFAEIEKALNHAKIQVIQWDTTLTNRIGNYRKGDWKKIFIHGRGGTDMAAAIDYVREERFPLDAVVLLTDGETPWPKDPGFPVVYVISRRKGQVTEPDHGLILYLNDLKEVGKP